MKTCYDTSNLTVETSLFSFTIVFFYYQERERGYWSILYEEQSISFEWIVEEEKSYPYLYISSLNYQNIIIF